MSMNFEGLEDQNALEISQKPEVIIWKFWVKGIRNSKSVSKQHLKPFIVPSQPFRKQRTQSCAALYL